MSRTQAWRTICAFCCCLIGGMVPASSQATIGGQWRDDVVRFAGKLIEKQLTPGMGIAVVQQDQVLFERGFGTADEASERGVGASTAFYIASSSKALTATAVLMLAEKQRIDIGAPITKYLTDLRFQAPLEAESVRVVDLLTMSEGMQRGGPVVFRTAYTGDFTQALLLDLLASYGPSENRGQFRYGNLPYNILGMILEAAVPGESWKDVIAREVLTPLEMNHTSAYLSRLEEDRIALPHVMNPDGFERVRLAKADSNLHAGGGHFTSPGDLARFLAAFLNFGNIDGRQVLAAEPLRAAQQKQVDQDRTFGPFHRFGWGYGWDLGTYEEKTVVHRFGGFTGYRSHMSFMPDHGLGVVVLVNGSGVASPAADLMATYIYDRMLGKPNLEQVYRERFEELRRRAVEARRGLAEELAKRAGRLEPLSHPIDDYAGRYRNANLGEMNWTVVAGGLEVRMGVARSRAEIYDAGANQLRVTLTGGGSVVTFTFPADGDPATSLQLRGRTFERVGP